MIFGGRFKRIEPRYVGDNTNNGVWGINEVYALKEAGVWPSSIDSSKDIYFESNKLLLSSRSSTIIDLSILNSALTVSKFQKQIIDGPNETPVNAMYNDDYSGANGSYAYILTAGNNDIAINDQDYTLECWVKPIRRQPNGYYTLFSTYKSGTDGAVFGFDNDGRIFADGGFGNWAFGNITGGINVSSGQWHHITFCRSNGILKCFVNGSQYGSSANSSKVHTANYMRVGNYDTQSFVGHITEVRLAVGVVRYTSSFSVPPIPLPLIEEEISPLAPILSGDSLYGDQSVELFWRNGFNGGSEITSFDIEHSTNSDISSATSTNVPIVAPVGDIDQYWDDVVLLLHGDGSNNSTSFIDSGPDSLVGSNQGSSIISTTQSKFGGSSMYFDGSSYISFGTSSNWDLRTSDFTIEFWVYHTGDGQYRGIIGARQSATLSGWCLYIHPNNTIYMGSTIIGQSYSDRQLNTTTIPANTWTHIAFVKTSDGYRLYVNGQPGTLLSFVNGLDYQSGQPLVVGTLGSQGEYPFLGYIDELRITNGVARYTSAFSVATSAFPEQGPTPLLTSYTVTGLTNSAPYYFRMRANNVVGNGTYSNIIGPFTPSATLPQRLIGGSPTPSGNDPYEYDISLLLHFDGDNASTIFTDSSSSPSTVTAVGGAQLSTTQSKFGGSSVLFANITDYISFPEGVSNFGLDDFTFECWLYPLSWTNNSLILGPSAGNSIQIGRYSTAESFGVALHGVTWLITNATLPPLNTWTHLAVTRRNGTIQIWLNGEQSGSSYSSTANANFSASATRIGGNGSAYFNGYIDDVRITKNVGRFTGTFTPPVSAYANPPVTRPYIGAAFKQDQYWDGTALANKIFDNSLSNNTTNQWRTTVLNSAFGVDFGIIQQVLRYRMWRNTGNEGTPTSWILQGSNTSSDWTNLQNNNNQSTYGSWVNIDTRSLVNLPLVTGSSPANQPYGEFVVSNPGNYRYYRLFVSAVRADGPGTTTDRIFLAEMQFLGIIAAANTPTNLSANPANGGASLSWSWSGANFVNYTVEWSSDGGSTVLGSATTTTPTYNVTGLVNGSSYVFRVKATNTVGDSSFTSWSDPVVPVAGYTPIQDNIFRFTMSESATSASVQASSTSGYYKVVSSTGQTSSIVSMIGQWGTSQPYFWVTPAVVSGMPTGQEKTLQVIACDVNGDPSGELEYVSLINNSQQIIRIDASGCTALNGFNVASSSALQFNYNSYSSSSLPSTITEVRCIGVPGRYGGWYQWNANYPPNVYEGINVAGQQLSAAALNQMYTDLATSRSSGAAIMVASNPGTANDDPTIATAKGYTVYGS